MADFNSMADEFVRLGKYLNLAHKYTCAKYRNMAENRYRWPKDVERTILENVKELQTVRVCLDQLQKKMKLTIEQYEEVLDDLDNADRDIP